MNAAPMQRLRGRSILLSASVPDPERDRRYQGIADAPFQIEQAVIALARAVFSEGGRLVFGGHPSISPLVALVAGEYREPRRAEEGRERLPPSVVIYQSSVFREVIPSETDLLIRLGLAEEHWTEPREGERFVRGQGSAHEQCPHSLAFMRTRMIEEVAPDAMVCIGGMEGVELEEALFRRLRGRPVFVLARTGGAAALLSERNRQASAIERAIDEELLHLEAGDRERDDGPTRQPTDADIEARPYPLIMQTIVDAIVEHPSSLDPVTPDHD